MPLPRSTWATLAVAWAALTWVLLVTPPPLGLPALPPLPPLLRPLPDKLGHAALFLVQALLLHRALLPARAPARGEGRALLLALLLTIAFGALTERVQLAVPGRDGDLLDLLADAVGAAGYGLLSWVRRPAPPPAGVTSA